ncbi:DUF6221 family protein [Streptomyces californicus]
MPQPTAQLLALADFNDARLAEDEAAAREVRGSWRQIGETGVIVASDGDRAEECANGNWTGIAEHIVRHDPERVLAEAGSKRLLMANWRALIERIESEPNQEKREKLALTRHGLDQFAFQLAAVHANHPDYQEGWRP